jgi:ElaB/YqjD/DUF883 family membrane-anchored ribosome-binding protein
MTTFDLKANWNQIKGGLRQCYAILTDDDLNFVEGKGEELLGRLQEKLGMGEDELQHVLQELDAKAGGLRGTVEDVKAKTSEVFEEVKHEASGYVEDAKAAASLKAEEVVAEAKQRARTLHEDAEAYVREQPRQALFTALAAGFVAGLLLRR